MAESSASNFPAPVITQLRPEIVQVAMQMPMRVDPVNAWVLRAADGSVVIFDTGLALHARAIWSHVFSDLNIAPSSVSRIVVSHHHPDHIGGVCQLHELTGAPLFASTSTIEQAPNVWGADHVADYFADVDAQVMAHGAPAGIGISTPAELQFARAAVELPAAAAWHTIDQDETLDAGDAHWAVYATPGHADGHIVLVDHETGTMLAGDHLLERISPAVGKFPHHASDPLALYLTSLQRMSELEIDLVLPGHGKPFAGARERCIDLIAHHERRIAACIAAVNAEAGGAATAFNVAQAVFPYVFSPDHPDPSNQRFAITESIAHLEHARTRGLLERISDDNGLMRYRSAVAVSGPVG